MREFDVDICSIVVATYLPYAKQSDQTTKLLKAAAELCYAIKDGRPFREQSPYAFVARKAGPTDVLAPDRVLVPLPGHSAGRPSQSWPATKLAAALVAAGRGRCVSHALTRAKDAPHNAKAKSLTDRARIEHHQDTLSANLRALPTANVAITLVDDVTTTGTTFVGAMLALTRAGYIGDVRAFAVFGTVRDGEALRANRVDRITWNRLDGYANRVQP